MLSLQFSNPGTGESLTVGPASFFRIEGASLYERPGGELIATHTNWQWQVGKAMFKMVQTLSRTVIEFEDDGAHRFGPGDFVTIVDGGLWLGPQHTKLLAKFIEDKARWHVFEWNQFATTITLTAG
jgi:hypothetical protein